MAWIGRGRRKAARRLRSWASGMASRLISKPATGNLQVERGQDFGMQFAEPGDLLGSQRDGAAAAGMKPGRRARRRPARSWARPSPLPAPRASPPWRRRHRRHGRICSSRATPAPMMMPAALVVCASGMPLWKAAPISNRCRSGNPRAALRAAAASSDGSGEGRSASRSEAMGLDNWRASSPPPNSLRLVAGDEGKAHAFIEAARGQGRGARRGCGAGPG